MTSAATSPDGSDTVYSRSQLLSLYSSPLVPSRLDGMKELADWYGEFTEPPSPLQQRHHLPTRPSDRGERGTPSRRPLQTDASNPFTNFGRFGVDGGLTLEEGAAAADRRRRGDISVVRGDKDLAPHLGGRLGGGGGRARDGDDGGRTSPTRDRGGLFERGERRVAGERGERRGGDRRIDAGRERAEVSNMERALQTEMERRKAAEAAGGDVSKKEMRRGIGPADEGGWRNVGLSREEREKRLTRTNSSTASSTLDSRRDDSRREGGSRNDRDYGRNGTATGERESTGSFSPSDPRNGTSSRLGGRPSWMADDGPSNSSGSSPAWMDAPANGQLSFGDGGVVQPKEEKKPAFIGNSKDAGGLDGIQAFKAQMKERERREMEQELRAAGIEPPKQDREEAREAARDEAQNRAQASVFDILTGSSSSAKETKSIFEDLGITRPPPGLPLPGSRRNDDSSQQQQGGGRGSRFAKFFDGKPPTTQASSPSISAAAPAPSVFGALMAGAGNSSGGGNDGAGGPSKEDAESMNRLLSMLQMGGSAKTSPSVQQQPTFQQISPPPQPHSQPVSPPQPQSLLPPHSREPSASAANAGEGRSGSRRNFAKSAVSSPQVQQQQPPPQLPPPAFGGYGGPPGLASPAIDPRSPPQQARGPPPQHHDLGLSSPLPLPASHPQPHQLRQHPHQHPQHPQHLPNGANVPNNAFSPPPPPPPGMPPQFYTGPPLPHLLPGPNGGRFPPPPSNMPNMPPQFALAPDGRPIPPPPQGFSPGGFRNGPLSPPISSSGQPSPSPNNLGPNGLPPPVPPQYRLPPGGQPPFPPHGFFPNGAGGPPPPPPPGYGGPGFPPQFGGPPPPGSRGIPPPPQMFAGGGGGMGALGNPGVDLMALLNSGAGGQRIGPQGQRQ